MGTDSPRPITHDLPRRIRLQRLESWNVGPESGERHRLELDLPFIAYGAQSAQPLTVSGGTFELEIVTVRGAVRADIRPAARSARPFHPYVEPVSGRWSASSPATAPPTPMGWVQQFVTQLCYRFAPAALDPSQVRDNAAARWYATTVRRNPWYLHHQLVDELAAVAAPRLELLPNDRGDRLELLADERRIELLETTRGYAPEMLVAPCQTAHGEGFTSRRGSSSFHLTIQGEAARKLLGQIGWGEPTATHNRVEQGGLLLGHVDQDATHIHGIAEDAVAANLAHGTAAHLQFSTQAWKEMLDYVDGLEAQGLHLSVIGWYHTHPGHLEVFMSSVDEETQRRLFNRDWHFSVVLNPQRQEFRVFHGRESEECQGNIVLAGADRQLRPPDDSNDRAAPQADGEETEIHPRRAAATWRGALLKALRSRLRAMALLIAALCLLSFLITWLASHREREPAAKRDATLPAGIRTNTVPAERFVELAPGIEVLGLLQQPDARAGKETLRILPGAALRVVSGPDKGWYRVQVSRVGWVRETEVVTKPPPGKRGGADQRNP